MISDQSDPTSPLVGWFPRLDVDDIDQWSEVVLFKEAGPIFETFIQGFARTLWTSYLLNRSMFIQSSAI